MNNIKKIVIVGGGSAGWMSAATLIRAFPDKQISVIESPDIPIVGVGESTIGGIRTWTRFINLDEEKFFKETDASYKLSIKFTDFYKKDYGSFHYPFGTPTTDDDRNPYTDWYFKKYLYPDTPTEDFVRCLFGSSALFENNKFSLNDKGEFGNYNPASDVAYHFDSAKFGIFLKENICKPQGVVHIAGTVKTILTNEDGISKLILEDGSEVAADLFVDCTGWKSLLLGETLKESFDSYAEMLPNNKAWATRLNYKNKPLELEGFTNCTAIGNGWCWNIPLWSRLGTGYVYSDKFISKEDALEEFKQHLMSEKMIIPRTREEVESLEYKDITMKVGIHKRTFVKNVVAIGLSAGFIEPLESNGLFSVHSFLFKLVDILQRGSISQFDRDMYNVSVRDMFDNFAKFVALHYALSHRNDSEYWRSIQQKSFTDQYNDPYFPFIGRSDSFYDMTRRYMENWNHPLNDTGITYIATGMKFNMINDARFDTVQFRVGGIENITKELIPIWNEWEHRKQRWQKASENCPTLFEYLKNRYYN